MPWKRLFSATTSTQSAAKRAVSLILLLTSGSVWADILQPYRNQIAPLAGQLWDIRNQQLTRLEDVIDSLQPGSWVLLGETHENSDHHLIETAIIEHLGDSSKLGAVAFEMANTEQQGRLDQAQLSEKEITDTSLNWQPGWPWEWYQAPVKAAITQASRVIATDLTRESKLDAFRNESLEVPASEAYRTFMLKLLYESHCEKLPESQLSNMFRVQYARDLSMLQALQANTDETRLNLMIAGTVHTRYDLGIPYWDEQLDSITILMIAATELEDPNSYYPQSYSKQPVADYILFTPPMEYESGC